MLIRRALREQIGHPVHTPAPGRLELVEGPPRPAHGVGIGAHELLASAALLGDQAGPLQHRDVLLHRGEAHRVVGGESRHRRLAPDAATEDVAARGIGQGMEQAVHVLVGQLTYNHPVVDYYAMTIYAATAASASRASSPAVCCRSPGALASARSTASPRDGGSSGRTSSRAGGGS